MSKPMNCKTVICKVNGITLLNLKDIKNNNNSNYKNISTDKTFVLNGVSPQNQLPQEYYNEDDIETLEEFDGDNDVEEVMHSNDNSNELEAMEPMVPRGTAPIKKGIYEMEKVETSIESVRQYINTSRRNGKVWHQCRWVEDIKNNQVCNYGSKWSGAMVNHIRSHLGKLPSMSDYLLINCCVGTGVKPFRCLYCNKLFTIACNLKNHLRIHHGLKAKIILNGGRRVRQMSTPKNGVEVPIKAAEEEEEIEEEIKSSDTSKLRIFKPSFVNGKVTNNPYAAQRRTLPKRNVKRIHRYLDFEDDFEDEEDFRKVFQNDYNEEEAEEDNRKFYENTKEEEDYEEDDASRFVVKRRYNKKLWFVCVWNPRQCKYRSHLMNEVVNHVKKHQKIRQLVCNWNHCSASFASQEQLESHQLTHKRQKFFKCNFENCGFQTINETALKMHKIRHKRQM